MCLPIALATEKKAYTTVKFCKTIAAVILTWTPGRIVHLGWKQDLAAASVFVTANANDIKQGTRSHWLAQARDIGQFRMRTGKEIVQRVAQMYSEQKQASLCLYSEIIKRAIAAHNEWVSNGGYHLSNDSTYGPVVADLFARATAEFEAQLLARKATVDSRLSELRNAKENEWSEELKKASSPANLNRPAWRVPSGTSTLLSPPARPSMARSTSRIIATPGASSGARASRAVQASNEDTAATQSDQDEEH